MRGKVFNVGVPDIDENVAPGWWRGEDIGGEIVDDMEEVVFPDLEADIIPEVVRELEQEDTSEIPILVEDSSDEEDGDDGDDDEGWGPSDDAHAPNVPSTQDSADVEMTQQSEPRHNNRERRGVPPLRLIEQYLATVGEEEANRGPQSV